MKLIFTYKFTEPMFMAVYFRGRNGEKPTMKKPSCKFIK